MLMMNNMEFRNSHEHVRRWYLSDGGYLGFHRVTFQTVVSASIWSSLLVWKTKLDDYYRVVAVSCPVMDRIIKDLGLEGEYYDVLIAETDEETANFHTLSTQLSNYTDNALREWYTEGDINLYGTSSNKTV